MTVVLFQRSNFSPSRGEQNDSRNNQIKPETNPFQAELPMELPHLNAVIDLKRFRYCAKMSSPSSSDKQNTNDAPTQMQLELGSLDFPDETAELRIRPFLTQQNRQKMDRLEAASIETFYDYLTISAVNKISRLNDISLILEIEHLIELLEIKTVMSIKPSNTLTVRLVS